MNLILAKITAYKPNIISAALTVLSTAWNHNESASLIFVLWNTVFEPINILSERLALTWNKKEKNHNCESEFSNNIK